MTDDLLPTMTLGCGEASLDRVPSAQTMASPAEDSAPAVVTAHIHALFGASLRHRRPGCAGGECRYQDEGQERSRDHHAVLCRLVAVTVVGDTPISVQGIDTAPNAGHGERQITK